MKISKIFHWLYFTVMMLPCVIIPIFAIYTRNENYNSSIEIEVEENKVVDFNQRITDNYTNTSTSNGVTFDWSNSVVTISGVSSGGNANNVRWIGGLTTNHKYALYIEGFSSVDNKYIAQIFSTYVRDEYAIFTASSTGNNLQFYFYNGYSVIGTFKPNLFDLTQMGLENATKQELKHYFPLANYPYTESEEVVIENYAIHTYNDTDVGSQFVYTLYNATDKYFNFDNFFGLDNVYSWIQLNWFSGNAPLGFAIFWHFFTYWLLASLAWLLFDLMVYVPLYIHRWLDKGAIE